MKTKGNVFIVTERGNPSVCTNEGIRVLSDIFLDEIRTSDIDAFVVCGGEIQNIQNMPLLYRVLQSCRDNNKVLGGICAGRSIVADALGCICDTETTEVKDRVILSPGNEYVDFALEIGKAADIFEDEADYEETVHYFKLFRADNC